MARKFHPRVVEKRLSTIPFPSNRRVMWLLLFLATLSLPAAETFRIKLPNRPVYDAESQADLERMADDLDRLIRDVEAALENRKRERRRLREEQPLEEMSFAELRSYFAEPAGLPSNNELRGLLELQRLNRKLMQPGEQGSHETDLQQMRETARALDNLRRPPAPRVELLLMPMIFLAHLNHPVGTGRIAASNVFPGADQTDPDLVDPPDSTFWKKPGEIAEANLFDSPGRDDWPDFEGLLWDYDKPKTSYGGNPGFQVRRGNLVLKVKFGEMHSEPFAARIFAALGYHVDQTDYVRSLKVKYDRRLFREFHLRKEVTLRIQLLRILPIGRVSLQKRFDPFQFISEAVLKDGTVWSGSELRSRLLLNPGRHRPVDDPRNFDPAVESQIDYLITGEANVQLRDPAAESIGPWEFGGLGHENLRELRGSALLAAWLGWFDSRSENTRLKRVHAGDNTALQHFFSDLGGALGKTTGVVSWHSDQPDLFPWTFTQSTSPRGTPKTGRPSHSESEGRNPNSERNPNTDPRKTATRPAANFPRARCALSAFGFRTAYESRTPESGFEITGFRPIAATPAFRNMTFDDARWMGRMIGRFTEQQLMSGLIASGFDAAEVRLLTEKLISRRDQMIQDLGLQKEIPLLRPDGVNRALSYDPATEGAVEVQLRDGRRAVAPITRNKIVNGRLVEQPLPTDPPNQSRTTPPPSRRSKRK
jgi:hypothetical protein